MRRLLALALLAGLLVVGACGTPRRGENLGSVPTLDAVEQRGQRVFMKHCNACHVGGSGALAPAINDKALPVFLMKFQVRRGLGAMPSFSKNEISDAELYEVMSYIKALRRAGPRQEIVRADG